MNHKRKPRKVALRRLPTLRRLPRDFSWQLLGRLFGLLQNELPESFSDDFEIALRERSAVRYHELSARWGLQCIPFAVGVLAPYKMAAVQLLVNLAKKCPTLETKTRLQRRADVMEAILLQEERCRQVNPAGDAVLDRARLWAVRILSGAPDIESIAEECRHGPGSSIDIPYNCRSTYFKYMEWPYLVSPLAQDLLQSVIRSDDRWRGALEQSYRKRYNIAPWAALNQQAFWENISRPLPINRITTVPKDGTKDRPIAIEPAGSIYLQLGVEALIRRCLLRFGLDLNDQQPNCELARVGSAFPGPLAPATLDLSNASDSVSLTLCERILPPAWFQLLCSVRSPYGELPDGVCLRYAKISSMGNGTTFVLESLIFYVLCLAISDLYGHRSDRACIRVYGDDIIIPEYLTAHLIVYLRNWGFTVNTKKSFLHGPVKESCGSDWYYGHNIRPVFLKEEPRDVMALIGLRNRLNRWFSRTHGSIIPQLLDDFFMKFSDGWGDIPTGSESDTEFESWIHCFKQRPEFYAQRRLIRKTPEFPGRDFWFRKLMHDLRGSSEAGNRFAINTVQEGRVSMSLGTARSQFYTADDGSLQTYTRQRFGG